MVTWYMAVCDKCKEGCHIICNTNYRTTIVYFEGFKQLVGNAFLNKHYGCDLRLIHHDHDLDFIFENEYDVIDRKDLEYRKLYVLENSMTNLEEIEKIIEKEG